MSFSPELIQQVTELNLPIDLIELVKTPEGKSALFSGFLAGQTIRRFNLNISHGNYKDQLRKKYGSDFNQDALEYIQLLGFWRGFNNQELFPKTP